MNQMIDKRKFETLLEGKTIFVGMGNRLHSDDGLGPCLVERIHKKIDAQCINVECSLDRYIGKIIREDPDTVLIIDAVHLEAKPGTFEVLHPGDIVDTTTSTHDLSPTHSTDRISDAISGNVYLLGVQPERLDLGLGLSRSVSKSIKHLERRIVRAMRRRRSGTGSRTWN